jgi:hypothetical protein
MATAQAASSPHPHIDELDRAIVDLTSRIYASSYELLVLIRRFDERGGWLRWGFSNCAEWLHWRCDLSMSAAREKVLLQQGEGFIAGGQSGQRGAPGDLCPQNHGLESGGTLPGAALRYRGFAG